MTFFYAKYLKYRKKNIYLQRGGGWKLKIGSIIGEILSDKEFRDKIEDKIRNFIESNHEIFKEVLIKLLKNDNIIDKLKVIFSRILEEEEIKTKIKTIASSDTSGASGAPGAPGASDASDASDASGAPGASDASDASGAASTENKDDTLRRLRELLEEAEARAKKKSEDQKKNKNQHFSKIPSLSSIYSKIF